MPHPRPATNPISFHKPTGQYYTTRQRRRIYLGSDHEVALAKYHRLALGVNPSAEPCLDRTLTAKELASRFILAQQANWRNPEATVPCYKAWLKRFLEDHPGLIAADLTAERFAAWKLSMRHRGYAPETINHCLSAVRAMYAFAADSDLLPVAPRLKRVKNESCPKVGSRQKPLYTLSQIKELLDGADVQVRCMLLLALNCGFGPKDVRDLTWDDILDGRITLPRSKTGVCQTYAIWPETAAALEAVRASRTELCERLAERERVVSDNGYVFVTRYWRPWNKDAVCEQFRKLCVKMSVPCYGFYRLRHCASTAISLVTNPHVHRKFMRHSQIQMQVGYTHTPDGEVDAAVMQARGKLLGPVISRPETGPEPESAESCAAGAAPESASCSVE